jgi:hypothetical protein
MKQPPKSPLDEVDGLSYFPRMTSKIRLTKSGELPEDYHPFLGKGLDARMCGFLRVDYEQLKARVESGESDETLLQWAFETGRDLDDNDKLIWNLFLRKLGWNDHVSENVKSRKAESGLQHRDDIQTMPHYIDVDEGHRP